MPRGFRAAERQRQWLMAAGLSIGALCVSLPGCGSSDQPSGRGGSSNTGTGATSTGGTGATGSGGWGYGGYGGTSGYGGSSGYGGYGGSGALGGSGAMGGYGNTSGSDGGQTTPEGCNIGDTCSCIGGVGICIGGSVGAACQTAADCPDPGSICAISVGGGANACARPCNKTGGCGATACPSGYDCTQVPTAPAKVCVQSGQILPPTCTAGQPCTSLPGATCVALGPLGNLCLLTCT